MRGQRSACMEVNEERDMQNQLSRGRREEAPCSGVIQTERLHHGISLAPTSGVDDIYGISYTKVHERLSAVNLSPRSLNALPLSDAPLLAFDHIRVEPNLKQFVSGTSKVWLWSLHSALQYRRFTSFALIL